MPIYANSFFAIGKSHTVCQDYADTRGDGESAALALSDGCSSSPNTDFGSRILVRAALNDIAKHKSVLLNSSFVDDIEDARDSLELPSESLDATLLLALAQKNKLHVGVWGDGVVVVNFKDGTSKIWEIEFPDNTPAYLNYMSSERRMNAYLKSHGSRLVHCYDGLNWGRTQSYPLNDGWMFPLEFNLADVGSVFLCSDGVRSFIRKNSDDTTSSVPLKDVIPHVTAVKAFLGEFMARRMKKFLGDFCPKSNVHHEDDVSVAALINREET